MKRHGWVALLLVCAWAVAGCGFLEGLGGSPPATPSPTLTVSATPTPTATSTVAPTATLTVTPTATEVPTATPTPTITMTPTSTPGTGPCTLVAESDVTVYQRPSFEAAVFGAMEAGMVLEAEVQAEGGWMGFEPGVAQAANIGVFRYRWVHESAAIRLEGDCTTLREVEAPAPNVCYTMPMEDVEVYAAPDPDADVVATLTVGDYAAVLARGEDYARVDLGEGNLGLDLEGWVLEWTLNLNGPCEGLPTPVP